MNTTSFYSPEFMLEEDEGHHVCSHHCHHGHEQSASTQLSVDMLDQNLQTYSEDDPHDQHDTGFYHDRDHIHNHSSVFVEAPEQHPTLHPRSQQEIAEIIARMHSTQLQTTCTQDPLPQQTVDDYSSPGSSAPSSAISTPVTTEAQSPVLLTPDYQPPQQAWIPAPVLPSPVFYQALNMPQYYVQTAAYAPQMFSYPVQPVSWAPIQWPPVEAETFLTQVPQVTVSSCQQPVTLPETSPESVTYSPETLSSEQETAQLSFVQTVPNQNDASSPEDSSAVTRKRNASSLPACFFDDDEPEQEQQPLQGESLRYLLSHMIAPTQDGYRWRKYGRKINRMSCRCYYRCFSKGCTAKKLCYYRTFTSTPEIFYIGEHNHVPLSQCPPVAQKSSQKPSGPKLPTVIGEPIKMPSFETMKAPEALTSQAEQATKVLCDGYQWKKYGQKTVNGNIFPRCYFRCTVANCPVKKTLERVGDSVVTTYEGLHNHIPPQVDEKKMPKPLDLSILCSPVTAPSGFKNQISKRRRMGEQASGELRLVQPIEFTAQL